MRQSGRIVRQVLDHVRSLVAPGVTMGDDPHSIFTGGGTALVVHAAADDMKSDPAGNAGARIACGVIAKM